MPLAPRARRLLHQAVGGVEERLQLGPRQRPPLRPALILRGVRRGVALVERLDRNSAHPLLTLGHPPVAPIAGIVQEQAQRALIGPGRRVRPPARGQPRLRLRRRPLPRPACRWTRRTGARSAPACRSAARSAAWPAAGAATRPASPRTTPAPAKPAQLPPRRPASAHPAVPPPQLLSRKHARCISQSASATRTGATSWHPAQPGRQEPRSHGVSGSRPPSWQTTPPPRFLIALAASSGCRMQQIWAHHGMS